MRLTKQEGKPVPTTDDYLRGIYNTLRNRYPQAGQSWGAQPILTSNANGGKSMLLFFTAEYASYSEYPQGQGISLPGRPFRFMILLNEGNCDIMFDTNWKPGNFRYSCLLRAQEDFQYEAKGDERLWSFGCYAQPASGPNPSLNETNWGGDSTTAHLRLIAMT
jgi:hypothetical protein